MAPKQIPPAIDLKSFSCPQCGAIADQIWHNVYAKQTEGGRPPKVWTGDAVEFVRKEIKEKFEDSSSEEWQAYIKSRERSATGQPFLYRLDDWTSCNFNLDNISISQCYSCGDISIWKFNSILYPPFRFDIEPNNDMREDIRADFDEARAVLDLSPRASAALLRLCVQKLCNQLEVPGDTINDHIKELVKKGLDPRIQKTLDIVRVIGNEAVHPGQLDMKDDRFTASKLFALVNRIAFDLITHPKEVAALYDDKLPESKKEGIAQRDAKKG